MYLLVPVHTIVKPPVLGQGVYSDRQEVLDRLSALLFDTEEAPEPGRLLCVAILGMDRTVIVGLHEDVSGDSPVPLCAWFPEESFLADRGIEP